MYIVYSPRSFIVADRESARASARRLAYSRDKSRGGAEISVWQTACGPDPCRRQPSLCGARRLIGPASRPISSRRALRKTPPRTRAECTQESRAGQTCAVSPVRTGQWHVEQCAFVLRMLKAENDAFDCAWWRYRNGAVSLRQAEKFTHVYARSHATPSSSLHLYIAVGKCLM